MGGNEEAGCVLAYICTKARAARGVDSTARAKSCCIQCAKACTVIGTTTLCVCCVLCCVLFCVFFCVLCSVLCCVLCCAVLCFVVLCCVVLCCLVCVCVCAFSHGCACKLLGICYILSFHPSHLEHQLNESFLITGYYTLHTPCLVWTVCEVSDARSSQCCLWLPTGKSAKLLFLSIWLLGEFCW